MLKDIAKGTTQEIEVYVSGIEEKVSRNGKAYLSLTLSDGNTKVRATLWDATKASFEETYKDHPVMKASIEAGEYSGTMTYTIRKHEPSEKDVSDFIISAPISPGKMFTNIYAFASEKLGVYSPLIIDILSENKKEILYWAAAKSVHHDIRGGLLYHTYRMLQLGCKAADVYKGIINKELLCAAIILHDIGKLQELSCTETGSAEYTVEGTLFGHLFLGAERILHEAGNKLPEKEAKLLAHCIVAHHGEPEYGAIVKPAIPEAIMLHELDMIDSRMYIFENTFKDMEPGTMSPKNYVLDTCLYKA